MLLSSDPVSYHAAVQSISYHLITKRTEPRTPLSLPPSPPPQSVIAFFHCWWPGSVKVRQWEGPVLPGCQAHHGSPQISLPAPAHRVFLSLALGTEKPGTAGSSSTATPPRGESSLFLNRKNSIATASPGLINPRLEAGGWNGMNLFLSLPLDNFPLSEESSIVGKFLQFLNLRGRI